MKEHGAYDYRKTIELIIDAIEERNIGYKTIITSFSPEMLSHADRYRSADQRDFKIMQLRNRGGMPQPDDAVVPAHASGNVLEYSNLTNRKYNLVRGIEQPKEGELSKADPY